MRTFRFKKLVFVCVSVLSFLLIFVSCDTGSETEMEETETEMAETETEMAETEKNILVTVEQIEETLYEHMWYARVVELMGEEGTRLEGEDIVYEWTLSDGKILRVTFEHPWCGMSVLPDEYSLVSYSIIE